MANTLKPPQLLTKHARASLTDLAQALKVSRRMAMQNRIGKLLHLNVIRRFTIELGASEVDHQVSAFKLSAKDSRPTLVSLRRIPAITGIHTLSGAFDIVIEIRTSSRKRLDAIIDQIREFPDVTESAKRHSPRRYCMMGHAPPPLLNVSQDVLKRGPDACPVGRVPAAEIEAAVIDQLRGIFRQPEIIVGTWRAARAEQDDITEDEAREALLQLDPLWDELFPAEQARIVQLLVERVDVRMHGVEVRLRPNGLAGLVREVAGSRRAAA